MDTTSLAPPTSVRPRSLRGSRPENEKHGAQTRAVLPSVIVSVKLVVRMHRAATWRNRAAAWRPEHDAMHMMVCIALSLMLLVGGQAGRRGGPGGGSAGEQVRDDRTSASE